MEEAPGKIELINPGISEDLAEPVLSLVHEPGHGAWRLERGGGDGPPRPLRREEAPVALLAWACLNGLVAPHTVLRFEAPATDLTPAEVHGAVRALREALPPERVRRGPAPEALRAPPRLAQALVLVNFGLDPLGRYTRRGEQLATRRPDPLSHGALRQCLVATLDLVARTSWGEVLAQRFEGATAVPDLIAELCAWAPAGGEAAPPPVAVRCFSSVRAADIARRLERLSSGCPGRAGRRWSWTGRSPSASPSSPAPWRRRGRTPSPSAGAPSAGTRWRCWRWTSAAASWRGTRNGPAPIR